jgi:hypothetical protein
MDGIDRLRSPPNLEMEVGAGACPGASLVTDHRSRRDHLAGQRGKAAEVPVERDQVGAVVHQDVVAVAADRADLNTAGEHGADLAAGRGNEVDTGVEVRAAAVRRLQIEAGAAERLADNPGGHRRHRAAQRLDRLRRPHQRRHGHRHQEQG